MMKLIKNYFIISYGSTYNRHNYVGDFESMKEAEATAALAYNDNPARNMAGTNSTDYVEFEIGEVHAIYKDGMVKIDEIGIFRVPRYWKLNDSNDLNEYVTHILELYYECGDQSSLNQHRTIAECQEALSHLEIPSWRWDAEKYLFNEKDKYYKLA